MATTRVRASFSHFHQRRASHLSSHLIWTHPGLRRKDQGWYHFSTAATLEHNTSSHRWSTCSLREEEEEHMKPLLPERSLRPPSNVGISLEANADEGPELDIHLSVGQVVAHVHRLHCLARRMGNS